MRLRRPALVLLFAFSLPPARLQADDAAGTAASHYRSGLAYERLGRLEEAYPELQVASNLDSENVSIAVALGVVASRLGRYEEAQRALEHSLALDANSVASYYQLALIYEKSGLTDRALDSWHRFLGLNQEAELKVMAQKHINYLEGRR